MSAVSSVKLNVNCNAVNSGSFINQSVVNSSIVEKSSLNNIKTTTKTSLNNNDINNGTILNQSSIKFESFNESIITTVVASPTSSQQQQQQQEQQECGISNDVQKVLKQEQELQKQLYSGSNVAPGWLRVNHNNKVIYISPSGIGLSSLKQVKDYLLTRGTCKCGLPFPLRVELFFNFNTEVTTVPLKTPIDSIKFDPTCQHRKKLTTTSNQTKNNNKNSSNSQQQQIDSGRQQHQKFIKSSTSASKQKRECLLPSYVTSKIINQSSMNNNSSNNIMIVNSNSNTLTTNNNNSAIQSQQQQQQQIMQSSKVHDPQVNIGNGGNLVMRIVKEYNESIVDDSKLPPWKKNSMQNQKQLNSGGIPIFQINGQMIAVDHQQQGNGMQQQYQIIEQKIDGEQKTIIRRRPTFKEDPTGYLNQQTALLQNTITTLHSPIDGGGAGGATATVTSNSQLENASSELRTQRQQHQFIQQIMKPGQVNQMTIGGQTVTHMSNGIVQIQNCDIKQQPQSKPLVIQEQVIHQNKYVRTNPKGRPPKNASTIAKRLVAMSQESPVSSSTSSSSTNNMGSPISAGNVMKITKANTPDISSSSQSTDVETMQVQSSFDGTEFVKFARNSTTTTQELIRTSMTQMMAGKTTSANTAIRKAPQMQMMMATKKPQIMTQVKSQCANNNNFNNPSAATTTTTATSATSISGNQQVVMTSNGQQFIVMPSTNIQPHATQTMLNNNAIVHFQNAVNGPKILQSSHQNTGNFIIQTNPLAATTGNFIVNQPSIMLQNGQIIATGNNLIASPKGNIFSIPTVAAGGGTTTKTIIAGNNQISSPLTTAALAGQQAVLLQNNVMPQSTIIHDPSSFMTTASSASVQQQQKIIVQQNPSQVTSATIVTEKKKGRKRKIPLVDTSASPISISHVQQQQQQQHPVSANIIQMATPPQQSFQLSPNFLVNKFPTQQTGQQIILQNGQIIQQQQQPIMALSPDGQLVQIQNPSFNNIITAAPPQKTIITNNGQQYIVQQAGGGGGQFQLPTFTNSPMGFVVHQQHNQHQQQIINPIQQIITQPQIITQSPAASAQAGTMSTMLTQQQAAQFIANTHQQNEHTTKRKIMALPKNQHNQQQHQQQMQSQKFFSSTQLHQQQQHPRTITTTTSSIKNSHSIPTHQHTIVATEEMIGEAEEEVEEEEEEGDELLEQEVENEENFEEMEPEELELSFEEDYKPDMIEELHHGTVQQLLHSSSLMNDGGNQFGIMNIDDIKIEMDEINDLNEYLNAIDEEDNRMSQMGLSSLQQFANSPPDTTTHSPRSPNDILMHTSSEKSNGSSEGNNMVSSSEVDSNVVSPECHHQMIDSVQSPTTMQHGMSQQQQQQQIQYHHSGISQPVFKLPMEPRSNIKSPNSTTIIMPSNNCNNIFDTSSNRSPLMRPDSHESASNEPSEEDEEENVPKKSDFDLLKESPPVNNIKPVAVDMMITADDPPCQITPVVVDEESNFKVGDLIWGVTRGCLWPGKIVNEPENEATSSNCVWVKWFGGRQNVEMVQCSTLKSLSEGLEAHHAARKETRTGRKLNSHLERAIQKAMAELDKQSSQSEKKPTEISSQPVTATATTAIIKSGKGNSEKKSVNSSNNNNSNQKTSKLRNIKIAPAPSK